MLQGLEDSLFLCIYLLHFIIVPGKIRGSRETLPFAVKFSLTSLEDFTLKLPFFKFASIIHDIVSIQKALDCKVEACGMSHSGEASTGALLLPSALEHTQEFPHQPSRVWKCQGGQGGSDLATPEEQTAFSSLPFLSLGFLTTLSSWETWQGFFPCLL